MSGRVRSLVPFFVPGQGDLVNESLHSYPLSSPPPSAMAPSPSPNHAAAVSPTVTTTPPLISVAVREWDRSEGFFRDAVHLVQDMTDPAPSSTPQSSAKPSPKPSPSPCPRSRARSRNSHTHNHTANRKMTPLSNTQAHNASLPSSPPQTTRLLTPADIRHACRKARPMSQPHVSPAFSLGLAPPSTSTPCTPRKPSPQATTPSTHNLARSSPRQPITPPPTSTPTSDHKRSSPSRRPSVQVPSPEASRTTYAGLSFEIASPPPSNLPLPAFKKRLSETPVPLPLLSAEIKPPTPDGLAHQLHALVRI